MASIILRSFGGMAPSANDKAISESTATWVQNLNLRYGDFRPLPAPSFVASASAGGTLYKFETTSGFITRPGEVNFVRGQIPTDATERTYYTGDGLPKVTDNTGAVRQLGVPCPAAAPTVAVNVVDEYSTDDAAAASSAKLAELTKVVLDHATHPYIGITDAELAPKFDHFTGEGEWVYSFRIPGTMINGLFYPTNPAHRNLMDNRLGFHLVLVGGVEVGYAYIHVRGYNIVYDAGLKPALLAITAPDDATKAMLTNAQADTIVGSLTDALRPADAARDTAIITLRSTFNEFVALADNGSVTAGAATGSMADFYASATVTGAINAAIDQAVSSLFSAMATYSTP
jgi:hypothetical protein